MSWYHEGCKSSLERLPYLYLCFLICGFSNCINKPKINPPDPEEALNLTNIVSSNEILENGFSTSFASGTKAATNTIKKKFLRRRLLLFTFLMELKVLTRWWYRSSLAAMFTLSRAQIQSKSKILGPGKIQRKITQLRPWSANMQIRASRLLIWIFPLWSLANTVFFYRR